jgi:hypothetical protein
MASTVSAISWRYPGSMRRLPLKCLISIHFSLASKIHRLNRLGYDVEIKEKEGKRWYRARCAR